MVKVFAPVRHRLWLVVVMSLVALTFQTAIAAPAPLLPNVHVDGLSGVDKPGCGDETKPCQSIGYALSEYADQRPTIYIRPGRYVENLAINEDCHLIGEAGSSPIHPARGTRTIVDGNDAGTVVVVSQGDVTLRSLTLTGGSAVKGGGVHCKSGSTTITDTVITENMADYGGGIAVDSGAELRLSHSEVMSNTASAVEGRGGGLWVDEGDAQVSDSTLSLNAAPHGAGGAIAAKDCDELLVKRCILMNNTARNYAAAVMATRIGEASIQDCLVTGNWTTSGACTVFGSSYSLLRIEGCTVADNATTTDCTACAWSGYDVETDRVVSVNTIWWNNGVTYRGPEGNIHIEYSLVEDGWAGVGNLDVDPLFAGIDAYDLQEGSPCIDAGTDPVTAQDLHGTPRPLDGDGDGVAASDMGCMEAPALYRLCLPVIR